MRRRFFAIAQNDRKKVQNDRKKAQNERKKAENENYNVTFRQSRRVFILRLN